MSLWDTNWEEEVEALIFNILNINNVENSHSVTVGIYFLAHTCDLKIRYFTSIS
jgi:hypothetical protein